MRIVYGILLAFMIVVTAVSCMVAMQYWARSERLQTELSEMAARQAAEPSIAVEPLAIPVETVEPVSRRTAVSAADAPVKMKGEIASIERPSAPTAPTSSVAGTTARTNEPPRRRGSDWMEVMRTNDPQRYAEMQQVRSNFTQRLQNSWDQKTNYFFSVDTSAMSSSEIKEFNRMLYLLDQSWALNQRLQSRPPQEERRQLATTLRSNVVELTPLLEKERDREYYQVALSMGQSEKEAAQFVTYINQIASNTSVRELFPGFGGRMGGPMVFSTNIFTRPPGGTDGRSPPPSGSQSR